MRLDPYNTHGCWHVRLCSALGTLCFANCHVRKSAHTSASAHVCLYAYAQMLLGMSRETH